ncbi:Myosin head, motor domain-containing protein [Rozella allomycis CSF55]|uniref:Myosin head, motor domain-containing protein n=1 Tax=Rozella allomycis (strain CSF55) TaxID=988480 RepID=A0A075AZ61_ROZAC|nr:Myosin head, motor domain-containing protein [Rozella allomycis CSF55]|eukprot:EPZ35424.1 Myosin head, motor domain-containing protein [Rozella allomycis CSF55]
MSKRDLYKNGWKVATIKSIEHEIVKVEDEAGEITVLKELPHLKNATSEFDDLTVMNFLHEPGVLKYRYDQGMIYTYSGIVLIALNPFSRLDCYGEEVVQVYNGRSKGELEPHLYAIAEDAFSKLRRYNKNQSVVISGESGSGKTVSAKFMMRYFASADCQKNSGIEEQVLSTNPIMEAFGNAKTTRNDNSSRFGKFVEILFDERNSIVERSRVIRQAKNERNYHIFYQLCAGLEDGALTLMKIDKEKQQWIFQVLAAILYLGNVEVDELDKEKPITRNLNIIHRLIGVDMIELKKWMTHRLIKMRNESIESQLEDHQVVQVRDGISKFLYSSLFECMEYFEFLCRANATRFIAVLDIYGFEYFENNSFEQFCINYANEKLQQEFNRHVFDLEQKEGINWSFIEFNDNSDCIEMIENRSGILSLLDEESYLPRGSDQVTIDNSLNKSFVNKLYQSFADNKNKCFSKPRFGGCNFLIHHFAYSVTYHGQGFIEKNKDNISEQVRSLLLEPDKLKWLLPKRECEKGSKRSLSLQFKPNEEKKPFYFDNLYVIQQLRACGILETIRISCAGFSMLSCVKSDDSRVIAESILKSVTSSIGPLDYQIGKTRIFFRVGQMAFIEKARDDKMESAALLIQKWFKGCLIRTKFNLFMKNLFVIQGLIKSRIFRNRFVDAKKKKITIKIQVEIRKRIQLNNRLKKLKLILQLQNIIRKYNVDSQFKKRKLEIVVVKIQCKIRGIIFQQQRIEDIESIKKIQRLVKCRNAKRELIKLREEAKSMNRINERNYHLENKVIELTNKVHELNAKVSQLTDLLNQKTLEMNKIQETNDYLRNENFKLISENKEIKQENKSLSNSLSEIDSINNSTDILAQYSLRNHIKEFISDPNLFQEISLDNLSEPLLSQVSSFFFFSCWAFGMLSLLRDLCNTLVQELVKDFKKRIEVSQFSILDDQNLINLKEKDYKKSYLHKPPTLSDLIDIMDKVYKELKENHSSLHLIECLFINIFSNIQVALVNQFLMRNGFATINRYASYHI